MSQHTRLTELAGIEAADDQSGSFWPLNMVLLLIGASILGVCFYFLDPHDQRLAYNPWTYALCTPVALLILSALLSTVVSRVVEKSMQLAFLLSVLVHVLLLVFAVNIVIFSRMWPELFDSLAKERHQLKREALQARQYYRISSATQSGRKPDYLRHVATEHQPTEVVNTSSPALALARSEKANLISPSPAIERTANPHLLPRHETSPALPTASEQAAALSRSELTQLLDQRTTPEPLMIEQSSAPEEVRPSDEPPARAALRSQPEFRAQTLPPQLESRSSVASLQRSEPTAEETPPLAEARQLSRDFRSRSQPATTNVPTPSEAFSPSPQESANYDRSQSLPRRRLASAADLAAALPAAPSRQPQANRSPATRQQLPLQIPEPTSGESPLSVAQRSAGGSPGLPAASSLPRFSPDLTSGGTSTPQPTAIPGAEINRRSVGRRRAELLAGAAPGGAPTWNSQRSLANGLTGLSPSARIDSDDEGRAASSDVADLSGDATEIRRSTLGISAVQGPATAPADALHTNTQTAELNVQEVGRELQAELTADSSSLRRRSGRRDPRRSLSLNSPLDPTSTSRANQAGLPPIVQRNLGPEDLNQRSLARVVDGDENALPRSAAGQENPTDVSVELDSPSMSPSSLSSQPALAMNSSGLERSSRGGYSSRLDIDFPIGQGGIAPDKISRGRLLPRRSSQADENLRSDLDAQRFAKQQAGGPLAAGQRVSLPQPAFEQRLERLRDRDPLDSTALEPETELAIERGLVFLAKHQRADGSWRLQDFDTQVLMRSDTAATGLSLLAFQGAGYTHRQFKYAAVVERAIQFLRQHQTQEGDLYITQDPASDQNARLYSHAIAALALCEAYGMTQDPELKPVAQRALDFMVASQDPRRGGWRYRPGRGSDTSVTGWFMMAFKSGQLAGLNVPAGTFDRIRFFLDQSQASRQQPYMYRYNPFAADTPEQGHGLRPTAVMTSVGLLMRLYFGWQREQQEMILGTDYLLQHPPEEGTQVNSLRDTYYWYYATQVLFHMGGERWRQWHDQLYPMLIEHQITQGEHAGSWHPLNPTPDLWARYGGRLYVTTMNLLSLEVSYRHLPLYDATGYDPVAQD